MGLQYRKSKSLSKNTRLNVSNKSVGISTGVKGAHVSMNSKGRSSINLSIPGSGLRYRKTFGKNNSSASFLMICIIGLMNLMIYMVQVYFVLIWWFIKFLIWLVYYFCLGTWNACKFIFQKLAQLVSYIITCIKKSKSQEVTSSEESVSIEKE